MSVRNWRVIFCCSETIKDSISELSEILVFSLPASSDLEDSDLEELIDDILLPVRVNKASYDKETDT